MGPIATTLKHLIAAGVTGDALVTAIAEIERAAVVQPEQKSARSRAAERTAKWRAKKSEGGGGRAAGDASDVTVTDVTSPVTVCDASNKFSPQTPLSNYSNTTTGADTREARTQAQRDLRNRTVEIFEAVKRHVNGSADWSQPKMHRVDMFIELMAPMKGDPCDLELDIIPAVQAAASKFHAEGGRLTSWNYVRPIAIENRDRRLAGIPTAEQSNGRRTPPNAGGSPGGYRNRGPSEDPLDRALAAVRGRQADPDIIEHPAPAIAGGSR
jgi:hypothetical protein